MLVSNCFRLYVDNLAEGSAHALGPGQWDSYRQFEKFIMPDGASAVLQTAADPPGQYLPSVYSPPIKVGEMSLRSDGGGGLVGNLLPSRNMEIDLTGAGDFSATAALVISMAMAMTGSGSLTATIIGRLNASIDMTGSGDLDADMTGIANMVIDLLGSGDLDATIAAFGDMSIDIVVTGTGLSTANIGQAVWSALAAANNTAGTMGAKMNSAASGGVDYSDMADAVRTELQAELTRIIELAQIHGLVVGTDLVVTATTRTAGSIVQDLEEASGTVTVSRAP